MSTQTDLGGETYVSNRLIRSAVEREFIIIGEALRVISKRAPVLFERIPEGRQALPPRQLSASGRLLPFQGRRALGPFIQAVCRAGVIGSSVSIVLLSLIWE